MSRVFNNRGVALEVLAGEIAEKRGRGVRTVELAKEYGVDRRSIQRALKWVGAERASGRPDNGLNLFDKVEDEAGAYWLGYLMGDSCVASNGNCIQVGSIDREQLEKLKEWGKIPAEVGTQFKSRNPDTPNQRDFHHLSINSQRTVTNAGKWGLVHDKNKRIVPQLPEKLMAHFWRGLWDADGSVGFNIAVLTCKPVFVNAFRKWLSVEGKGQDGYCGGIHKITEITWRCAYSGLYARMVCDRLYRGASVYMDRKHRMAGLNLSK